MARGSSSSFKRGGGRGGSRGFRGNNTSFRGGRGRGRGRGGGAAPTDAQLQRDEEGNQLTERFEQVKTNDEVDEKLGFARVQEGPVREGWLINMHPVSGLRNVCGVATRLTACLDTHEGRRLAWREGCRGLLLHPRRRQHVQEHAAVRALLLHSLQGTFRSGPAYSLVPSSSKLASARSVV